jgi:DNA-binding beta-propeller fold protein YncE
MDFRLCTATMWILAMIATTLAHDAFAQTESRSVMIAQPHTYDGDAASRLDGQSETLQYWADIGQGVIRRSLPDGSFPEDLVTSLSAPYGIAYDDGAEALLWTSAGEEIVQKLDFAGGARTSLLSAFEEPYAIDISNDYYKGYYSAIGNEVYLDLINRATGEESTYLLLIVVADDPIHGLALDPANNVLYVGDSSGRMTRRIDLVSNESRHLVYRNIEPTVTPPPPPDGDEPQLPTDPFAPQP